MLGGLSAIFLNPITKRPYPYRDTRSASIRFGEGLRTHWDWKKDDALTLFASNCIDTPAIIFGCLWAGGIISPADPGYTVDELVVQLKGARTKAIATQKPFLETLCQAAKRVGLREDRILLIGDDRDNTAEFIGFDSIQSRLGGTGLEREQVDPQSDLAFLVYSSGTTGCPKGVMLSHTNMVANILLLGASEGGNL